MQIAALTLPWLFYMFFPEHERIFYLGHIVTAYMVAGLMQLVSCVANWRMLPKELRARSRGWYEAIMCAIVGMGVIAVVLKAVLLALLLYFYIVPVTTVWYLVIVISELLKIRKHHGG